MGRERRRFELMGSVRAHRQIMKDYNPIMDLVAIEPASNVTLETVVDALCTAVVNQLEHAADALEADISCVEGCVPPFQ